MTMIRREPDHALRGYACSIVAVSCALKRIPQDLPRLRNDGWASLEVANKFIRAHLPVKKKVYFKRGQRPRLRDFHVHGTAIVCVYGHLIYVDHEEYYSFFDNLNDEVVCVWLLKDQEKGLKLI